MSRLHSQCVEDVLGDIGVIEIANDAVTVVRAVSDLSIILDGWVHREFAASSG
jgi:hypothetical protein